MKIVSEAHKHVLGLHLPTDPRWVNLAEMHIGDILTDHAYCEQKAATSCISLIQSFPECTEMVRELAPVVTEEWGHFRAVLAELDKRGLPLGRQRKDEYVNALRHYERKHSHRMDRVAEKLIVFALIEARSCERFRLLSLYVQDEALRSFYHKFMVAEAGHYRLMIDLAAQYVPKAQVEARWAEFLEHEAEVLQQLEVKGDRMH